MNSKMQEAVSSDLNGLLSGGRPPEKLLQVGLVHAIFPSRGLKVSCHRPYTCPVDDCHFSYRRKDHLPRHLLQHQGKLFNCPIENCNREFSFQGNMKRHVKEFHDEDHLPTDAKCQKQYVCPEIGCGKVFRFASKLWKHEDSHVKLDLVVAFCCEPGCMKYFANDQCLKAHIKSCHQHITCEICRTKQLKKNIKRHMRIHEAEVSLVRIKCHHKGGLHTFSNKSNLHQHVKAVHLDLKPFACSFTGCGMRFAHKHVRDNHEKTGNHVYTPGDFEESDEHFQSRPRGGRKRKGLTTDDEQKCDGEAVKVEPGRNEMSGSLAKTFGVTKRVIILKICKLEELKRLGKVIKSAPIDPTAAYREKVRKELELVFSRVANEADEGGVKPDVTAYDPVRVAAKSAMFRKIGWSNGIKKAKYRSVVFNLNDQENPDLQRKVLLGQIKLEVLVTMSAVEMASQKRQRENIQIQLKLLSRCLHDADLKEKASTNMFQCSQCRERKCIYYQLQTRSADEPMTTYVTCVNCNSH
ncbi:hypothetical protein FH972_020344 [Carpinus fangiana]|uniref:C2H2-type domain-containing protein n=1 Tax=Carpinus fangiana TaxID=176857 RepID=A0A5N6RWE5_9ROSI|nr:hypothetical protein FH972_020344 [Carpinus fangiana]